MNGTLLFAGLFSLLLIPLELTAVPVALPMNVMAQAGQTAEFAPLYKGMDSTCVSPMVPVIVGAPLHGTIAFQSRKSWNWFPTGQYRDSTLHLTNPTPRDTVIRVRTWSKVPVTWFQYTPTAGFTGLDSFTYNIGYGAGTTNTEKCVVRVHPKEPGGMLVLLVVNDVLLPAVTTEVNRLKSDLETEGYTSRIMTFANSTMSGSAGISDTNACKALWDSLRSEYGKPNQMVAGAILIGKLPSFAGSTFFRYSAGVWDDPLWNMANRFGDYVKDGLYLIGHDSTANDTSYSGYGYSRGLIGQNQRHIWVSRIWGLGRWGGAHAYGSELTLVRRMLDANHDFRTGASRYPHTAWAITKDPIKAPYYDPAKLTQVWPTAINMNLAPNQPTLLPEAYYGAGDYLDLNSHGSAAYYAVVLMSGISLRARISNDSAMSRPFQIRYFTPSACHTADPGAVTNSHLYSRGGGCVFSTGAVEYVACAGYLGLGYDFLPSKGRMRGFLASGERWGRAWLKSGMPVTGGMFYGDGSLGVKMFPSNELPAVSAVSATALGAGRMRIAVTASDPEGSVALYEYWINRKYNLGRNEPDSAGAALGLLEKRFDSVTTVHLEVMDNYKARTTVEFTVVPDSGIRKVSGLTATAQAAPAVISSSSLTLQPNPFHPGASVYFGSWTGKSAPARLEIFGADGRLVFSRTLPAGFRTAHWNGRDNFGRPVGAGLYLFKVTSGKMAKMVRGLLVR